jgi:dethiobiotin synthetase
MRDATNQPRAGRGIFVTAVGTGIGKTLVTAVLCQQLTTEGRPVRAIKPVVSGFSLADPASDPAIILRSLGRTATPGAIEAIAPWRFSAPISPHLAARLEGRPIPIDEVVTFCRTNTPDDGLILIEGAGGVMTPIGDTDTCIDFMARLGHPVILVTGSYLGAISHTLTALATIRGSGLVIAGIVVSQSEQCVGLADAVDSIIQFSGHDIPVHSLPRLHGTDAEKWQSAPRLTALCNR